jgi:L-ribulose-5-phosphate 3-epimerase
MFLGYNTNGLAHHDPLDAITLIHELGYRAIGLTIDHRLCSPFDDNWQASADVIVTALERHGLRSVIETGARFLLDPRVKHEPTLVSPDPARRMMRVEFLLWAIDVAAQLGSDCVSFWSGVVRDDADDATVWRRLLEGLKPVVSYAAERRVTLAFEPEPGMFIDTMARYEELLDRLDAPQFRLTLDIGHLHCQRETPIADVIRRFRHRIANIHIEDMREGVHEHLMFGKGEIDFPPIIAALREIEYDRGIYVELSRHSHEGPAAARCAIEFLRPLLESPASG